MEQGTKVFKNLLKACQKSKVGKVNQQISKGFFISNV